MMMEGSAKLLNGLSKEARFVFFRRWVFTLGIEKLDKITRTSGKSMSAHIAVVCALLREFDAPLEVWVAGALHDIEEGYLEENQGVNKSLASAKLRRWLSEIVEDLVYKAGNFSEGYAGDMLAQFSSTFVNDVEMLIDSVTEPRKSKDSGNWRHRKMTYLEQVREGDFRVSLLACGTKIDALLNVVEILDSKEGPDEAKKKFTEWSKGTPGDNFWLFQELLAIFKEKEISPLALEMYEHLLNVAIEKARKIYHDDPSKLEVSHE
jgi:hypothetical protein